MNEELMKSIKGLMAEILEVTEEEIGDDTAIGDITSWDSLHHLLIISAIEKQYGIHFTPDVLIDIEDVTDIVRETARYLGA